MIRASRILCQCTGSSSGSAQVQILPVDSLNPYGRKHKVNPMWSFIEGYCIGFSVGLWFDVSKINIKDKDKNL